MDKDTILFLIALIGCGIGLSGFMSSRDTRSKQDGELLAQLNFCVKGIEKIEKDVSFMKNSNTEILAETATQGNRISTLEREVKELKERYFKNGTVS